MMWIVFCLLALLMVIAYVYKKVKNPYVKVLLILLAIPVGSYAFLYYFFWGMTNSTIASALPCILLFGFVIFKAVQWQRQKSKSKAEDSD